jgi:hypothetical protein
MRSERLAVHTTVYPGAEPYLAAWYQSIQQQTDKEFDLYISVDSLSDKDLRTAFACKPCATLLKGGPKSSPAQIRSLALGVLVDHYDAVVLVDSDDVLEPSRISAARTAMRRYDVAGCALQLIDEAGQDMGFIFGPTASADFDNLLPCHNIFGLSNSAYRSRVLRHCLPIPDDCELIDWLLSTRAWARGATLGFDFTPRMAYRRHARNVTPLLPPFTAQQVLHSARLVVGHYRLVLTEQLPTSDGQRARLETAQHRAQLFQQAITNDRRRLTAYVEALNQLQPEYVWWWCVAHPELEEIWKD